MHITYPSITRFQEFVELKDYRPPTKKEYVRYVRKLAEHFKCDPLTLSEDQLRSYFLFLRQDKHYTRSPMKAAKFSLRSFFVDCHGRTGWTVFSEVRIAEPLLLPVVLSREEVAAVLGAVREPRLGVCLELIYHCGLRVGEAVQNTFRLARAQSGINASATPHTLRHSYATHLLEEGVSLLQISRYLGHGSLDTTVIYTHLTSISEARTRAALETLQRQLHGH